MTNPDQSEQQLRRALGTMNDLQPPTDELFVQRAVIRGRARTARRRNALVGVAAALVVVAGGGGAWLLRDGVTDGFTTSAGAPEIARDSGGQAGPQGEGPSPAAAPNAPSAPGREAAQGTGFFVGPMTEPRAAIEALAPRLTTDWAATFSGAWAKDETNEHLVVALTHPDRALERSISANVRDAGAVEFVTATHSYADKAALAERVLADSGALKQEGIVVASVAQDYRADRVVIVAWGPGASARLTDRYGADWVSVTVLAEGPTAPQDGSTIPTLPR